MFSGVIYGTSRSDKLPLSKVKRGEGECHEIERTTATTKRRGEARQKQFLFARRPSAINSEPKAAQTKALRCASVSRAQLDYRE
jgi:hypothetical protein